LNYFHYTTGCNATLFRIIGELQEDEYDHICPTHDSHADTTIRTKSGTNFSDWKIGQINHIVQKANSNSYDFTQMWRIYRSIASYKFSKINRTEVASIPFMQKLLSTRITALMTKTMT
jgi:hypothetical protein